MLCGKKRGGKYLCTSFFSGKKRRIVAQWSGVSLLVCSYILFFFCTIYIVGVGGAGNVEM